jgi:DNA-binding CsgD family transcriptional regulator
MSGPIDVRGTHAVSPIEPQAPDGAFGTRLTPRELEVMGELVVHPDRASAAACIGIAVDTLKHYVTSAFRRLGAESLVHAFVLLGWVNVPPGVVDDHIYRAVRRDQKNAS